MKIVEQTYSGERPLYGSRDLELLNVTIQSGESALKECRDIVAKHCRFEGKYVFWEDENVLCEDSVFAEESRASAWYGRQYVFRRCQVAAPKMFREIDGLSVEQVRIDAGAETFWHCQHIQMRDVELLGADYCFLHAVQADISRLNMVGNYTFQYTKQIRLSDSQLHTRDAFWQSEACVISDCELQGAYLGWYSKNLHLVRCHISGTQPLCYCENLLLEQCTFAPDADRALEKSTYTIIE